MCYMEIGRPAAVSFHAGTILTKYMGFFQSRSKAIFCHTAEKMFFIYISLPGGPLNTFK